MFIDIKTFIFYNWLSRFLLSSFLAVLPSRLMSLSLVHRASGLNGIRICAVARINWVVVSLSGSKKR